MKILVLFSGTGSVEKVFDKETNDIRGLDFDNTFKPYFNVDILKWDYKTVFNEWVPDYIHSSPVCKEFSNIKYGHKRDTELGLSLLNKSLEIIEYVKSLNNKLKYTIENPKGLMRKLDIMKNYNRITTSYCMYGYPYKKETDFWYGGFELKLLPVCRRQKKRTQCCDFLKENDYHLVRMGVSRKSKTHFLSNEKQIPDNEYWKQYRIDNPEYKKYTDTYFRYRIPQKLCEDIKKSLEE